MFILQAPLGYNSIHSWWGTVAVCGPYCYTVFILQAPLGYNSIYSWWGTITVCGPYCYTVCLYYWRHWVITESIAGGVLLLCAVLIVILCFITGATGL